MKSKSKSTRSPTGSKAPKANTEQVLAGMLAIIKSQPGLRPAELNRRLKRVQSDSLRAALIRRGLVRRSKSARRRTSMRNRPGPEQRFALPG
jgi:hypothetical protein